MKPKDEAEVTVGPALWQRDNAKWSLERIDR